MMKQRIGRTFVCIAGLLALAVTWYAMFWWLAAMTEGLLVPWDTTPQRPAVGTLARSVNDFFEAAPGAYLPAVAMVGGGVALFAAGLVRKREGRAWLPATVAVANAAFLGLDLGGVLLSRWLIESRLPSPQTGYDLGYNRTWLAILVTVALLALLYWVQWRVTSGLARPAGHPRGAAVRLESAN